MNFFFYYEKSLCLHTFSQYFSDVQIETRNNKLEMQSVNNKSLIEELDKLLEQLSIPADVCLHVVNSHSLSLMNLISLIFILMMFHLV